jgi:hypothetical protein
MYWTPSVAFRLLGMCWLILMLIALSGCASGSSPTNEYCLIAKPITGYAGVGDGLKAQIEQHNSDFVCRCEDDCQ